MTEPMTEQQAQLQAMQSMIADLAGKMQAQAAQPAQPSPFAAPVVSPFAPYTAAATFAELEIDLEVKATDGSALNVRGKLPHPENVTPANLKETLAAYLNAGWPLKFWSPRNPVGKKF